MPTPGALLGLYSAARYGEFDAAISRIDLADRDLFKEFRNASDERLKLDATPHQRLIAATVALEYAHRLRNEPADRPAEFLIWASKLEREAPPGDVTPAERLWNLAILTGMQELSEPWVLTLGAPASGARLGELAGAMPKGGQLAVASTRLPNEPRLALAKIDGAASDVTYDWGFVPAVIAFERRVAAMPVSSAPRSSDELDAVGFRNNAARALVRRSTADSRIAEYRALESPGMRAELAVRIGRLEAGQGHCTEAAATVEPATHDADPYFAHLAYVLVGRCERASGNRAAAVAAFERALEIWPGARTATTLLAADLVIVGDAAGRARAEALLREANEPSAPYDPWELFQHGDAHLWPRYIAELRGMLK